MKHFFKPIILTLSILIIILSFSCSRNQTISTIREEKLFTVNYGKYENELHLFNLSNLGQINTKLYMKDGFFFIDSFETDKLQSIIQAALAKENISTRTSVLNYDWRFATEFLSVKED